MELPWWTAERVERLRELWNDGLPVTEIGRKLGCTKNKELGKAHRLGLQERRPPAPKPETRPDPFDGMAPNDCRWPIGHPRDPHFHFCRSEAAPGKPYCAEHCACAYGKPEVAQRIADTWTPERRAAARKRLMRRMAAE